MPRRDYTTCRKCGRHRDEVGPISHSRHCTECAWENLEENVTGLVTHTGPAFHRWRYALAASVGATPLDLVPEGNRR